MLSKAFLELLHIYFSSMNTNYARCIAELKVQLEAANFRGKYPNYLMIFLSLDFYACV